MQINLENVEEIAKTIELELDAIILQSTPQGLEIWQHLISNNPADTALVFNYTSTKSVLKLLENMEEKRAVEVFEKLDESIQVQLLPEFSNHRLSYLFKNLATDQLTLIFENFPNQKLERYLNLTKKEKRQKILSSLQSEEKTAGRVLNRDVLTLHKEITIQKIVNLLQHIESRFEFLTRYFVVSPDLKLIGFVDSLDLLKNKPETKIEQIMKNVDITVNVNDHQKDVAEAIRHYDLTCVPVVDDRSNFLGIITANDVLEIMEEEQTEDSFKMSGISGLQRSYVNINFLSIVVQRSKWLIPLLLFQSISGFITNHFEILLSKFGLVGFLTMLVGTGGNVGNQSSTFFVRGLATGEVNRANKKYLLLREFFIAITLGLVLVSVSVLRVRLVSSHYPSIFVVGSALFLIVITSVLMGAMIPLVLDHYDVDPASSAAPFISTLMDIIGVTIYCLAASLFLR